MPKDILNNLFNKQVDCPEDTNCTPSGSPVIDITGAKCSPPQQVVINYGDGSPDLVGNLIAGDNVILVGTTTGRLVGLGDVTINVESPDLSNYIQIGDNISELVNNVGYITSADLPDLSIYYTKTELQTPGQSQIHFDNLTNVPAFLTQVTWDIITGDQSTVNVGAFNNDAGYITSADLPDLSNYLQIGDNVSQLVNDVGYITSADLPSTPTLQQVTSAGNTTTQNIHAATFQINPFPGLGDYSLTPFGLISVNDLQDHSFSISIDEIISNTPNHLGLQFDNNILTIKQFVNNESDPTTGNEILKVFGRASGEDPINAQDFVTLNYLEEQIPDLSNYIQQGDNISLLVNDVGYATQQWVLDQEYITIDDIPAPPAPQTLSWLPVSGTLAISGGNNVVLDGRYSLLGHTHTIAEVIGLQAALDGKEDAFAKGNLIQGDNVTLTGVLTSRLVGSGDITIDVEIPPVDLSDYYTKTELQTSGDAQVHWDNLTNVPAYVPTSRTVTVGTGLTGGGSLAANISIAFDTVWGDARYLQSFTETDPTVPAWVKAITQTNVTNWNNAFSWGDHTLAGYALAIRTISAGTGLTGGGNLTANRTISFDTVWGDTRYSQVDHTHTIADITGLQTALNNKVNTSTTLTPGYAISITGSWATGWGFAVDSDILDSKYLRRDIDDNNGEFTLTLGNLITETATVESMLTLPSLGVGNINTENILTVDALGVVKSAPLVLPTFGFTVTTGSQSMSIGNSDTWTFVGGGDTTIAINSATKTVTVNSIPGSGTGGVLVSFNGRTEPAAIPVSGDYDTSMVPENGPLYFTEARVRSTDLAGFTATNTAIVATDNIIQAFGKAQGQINARVPTSRTLAVNGTAGNITVSGGVLDLSANRAWTVNLATAGTAGTYTKVTTDAYGRVVSSSTLVAADIPNLPTSKITSGIFTAARLGSGTASASTYLAGDGTWKAFPSIPAGTVTSVGLSMPSIFSVASSPITSSGTLGVTLVSQTAGLVFASPATTAGIPGFRALVATDIPTLAISKISGLQTALDSKENLSNKVTNFTTVNNTVYPTTQAVVNYVTSQIPAAQTLSLGGPTGSISISGGNTVELSSLGRISKEDANTETGAGFTVYSNTTGSVNYPAGGIGSGFRLNRNGASSALASLDIWQRQVTGGTMPMFRVGTSANTYSPWYTFASEEWANANLLSNSDSRIVNWTTAYNRSITGTSFNTTNGILSFTKQDGTTGLNVDLDGRYALPTDIPNNYVTTDTAQSGLSGNKTWVGNHMFYGTAGLKVAPSANSSFTTEAASIEISKNVNGAYIQGFQNATTTSSFVIRGYAQSGIQMLLNEGGIDAAGNSSFAASVTTPLVKSADELVFQGGTGIMYLTDVGLGIGNIPSPARASALQVQGNIWGTDAYILGTTNSPIAEFGLDGNVFIRTMGTQSLALSTNDTNRIVISGSGTVTMSNLSGTGSRMVVASSTGLLTTQAIPTYTAQTLSIDTNGDINLSGGGGTITPTALTYRGFNWDSLTLLNRGYFNAGNGGPASGAWHGIFIPHHAGGLYGTSLAFRNNQAYFQSLENGTWNPWTKIATEAWTSANFMDLTTNQKANSTKGFNQVRLDQSTNMASSTSWGFHTHALSGSYSDLTEAMLPIDAVTSRSESFAFVSTPASTWPLLNAKSGNTFHHINTKRFWSNNSGIQTAYVYDSTNTAGLLDNTAVYYRYFGGSTNVGAWQTYASREWIQNYGYTSSGAPLISSLTDMNIIGRNQFFRNSSAATSPFTSPGVGINLTYAANRQAQLNLSISTSTTNALQFRQQTSNDTWGPVRTVWHDGNFTPSDYLQTLSVSTNAGTISISGGNSVNLQSLSNVNGITEDWAVWANTGAGFRPFANTTGSTGFPSVTGAGYIINRNGGTSTAGSFALWTANSSIAKVYLNVGIGSSSQWDGWKAIATEDWVTSQIPTVPTNYVTTNTTQSNLSGNKVWTGTHRWESSGSVSAVAGSMGIGNTGLGIYLQAFQPASTSTSFLLRSYETGGIQLVLANGGISTASDGTSANWKTAFDNYVSNNPTASSAGFNYAIDFNAVGGMGAYIANTASTNTPNGSSTIIWGLLNLYGSSTTSGQIAMGLGGSSYANNLYWRERQSLPWKEIYHSGNLNLSNYVPTTRQVIAGTDLSGGGSLSSNVTLNLNLRNNTWINDAQGNPRLYLGASTTITNNVILRASSTNGDFQFRNSDNGIIFQVNGSGTLVTGTIPWSNISGQVSITAGNGLSGGGALTASRTITLGTPGSVTLSSTNSVSSTSHTHAFAPGGTTSQYLRGDGSLAVFPNVATYPYTVYQNPSVTVIDMDYQMQIMQPSSVTSGTPIVFTLTNTAPGTISKVFISTTNSGGSNPIQVSGANWIGGSTPTLYGGGPWEQGIITIYDYGTGGKWWEYVGRAAI